MESYDCLVGAVHVEDILNIIRCFGLKKMKMHIYIVAVRAHDGTVDSDEDVIFAESARLLVMEV